MGARAAPAASLFAALTAVGAHVSLPLPFSPVPVTLQTLFVLLSALVLGGKLGALSQLLYVAAGALGLPVFAGGRGGAGALLGPTGGYLFGFVAGAYAAGLLAERLGRGRRGLLLSAAAGTCVIYAFGALWLSSVAGLGLWGALAVGVLPFLPGDAAKVLLAAEVALRVRRRLPSAALAAGRS